MCVYKFKVRQFDSNTVHYSYKYEIHKHGDQGCCNIVPFIWCMVLVYILYDGIKTYEICIIVHCCPLGKVYVPDAGLTITIKLYWDHDSYIKLISDQCTYFRGKNDKTGLWIKSPKWLKGIALYYT